MAKLHAIFGCMGVGKTEDLIREYNSYKLNHMDILTLKSKEDTRNGTQECLIVSRNGNYIPAEWIEKEENIFEKIKNEIENNKRNLKAIIIDECNFLTEKQIEEISSVADFLNIDCYCYSLPTNYMTYAFKGSRRLFELMDHDCVRFMTTRDSEGNIPNINAKVINGEVIKHGKEIEIGDSQYKTITRKNWKLGRVK